MERQSIKVLSVQCSLLLLYINSTCANNEASNSLNSVRKEYDHVSSPLGLKKKATCPKSLMSGSLILSIVCAQTEKCERGTGMEVRSRRVSKENLLSRQVSEVFSEALTHDSELNINGTCYKTKMASVRFGSLQDFLIGKEKTRSTNLIMLYQVYPDQSQVCCQCAAGLPEPLLH